MTVLPHSRRAFLLSLHVAPKRASKSLPACHATVAEEYVQICTVLSPPMLSGLSHNRTTLPYCCRPPPVALYVQVHWSQDWSSYGYGCKKESGNVTIVPGSGGAEGQQVASCSGSQGDTGTLYCQVNVTAATSASASGTTTGSAGALSLQAHFTNTKSFSPSKKK